MKVIKEFAIKGNMFDMAIGIILGTAFNKMVTSLVNDIITPCFGLVLEEVDFHNIRLVLRNEIVDDKGAIIKKAIAINLGNFAQIALDFLIISVTIFVVVKLFNSLRKKAEDEKKQICTNPKKYRTTF